MNKFKVGDRVAAYSRGTIWRGEVTYTTGCMVRLCCKSGLGDLDFHYKQCRKIRTIKKQREFWIVLSESNESETIAGTAYFIPIGSNKNRTIHVKEIV